MLVKKNCFFIIFIALLSINCISNKNKSPIVSGSSKNKQYLIYAIEGAYEHKIDSVSKVRFFLYNIDSNLFYFQFFVESPQKIELYKNQQLQGTFKLSNDRLSLEYFNQPLYALSASVRNDSTITVDSSSSLPQIFNIVKGDYIFKERMKDSIIDFMRGRGKKWDELKPAKPCSISLYTFPSLNNSHQEFKLGKDDIFLSYADLYKSDTSSYDFYFVRGKVGKTNVNGWMYGSDYLNKLDVVYKCELHSDGIIEKWNKEKGYTLYYTKDGKFIKRVNDN
jgi:hypothetical protein